MAGEGSIQGMITSLNNNKRLLRRSNLFKKQRSFLNLRKEYLKAAEGQLEIKQLSKEELSLIRKKVLKQRRKDNIITLVILLISIIVVGLIIYSSVKKIIDYQTQITKVELKKSTNNYLELIADGDNWLKEKKWHNAIFYYKKGLEIFPYEYDINLRLAMAYTYRCKNEFNDCDKAKELLDKLLVKYADKPKLLELKQILEFEYQDD